MVSKRLLFAFLVQILAIQFLFAMNSHSQDLEDVKVTLNVKSGTLKAVLDQIQQQSEFSFTYTQALEKDKQKFTFSRRNGSVREVLQLLANNSDFAFKRINKNIYVTPSDEVVVIYEPNVAAEEIVAANADVQVSGTVTDQNGEPLPGATITVQGTVVGTVSDVDGKYSISVPEGATLVFTFIGYETQRIQVGTQTIINIRMMEDASSLEEVVVVGYGTQRRSDLTGSVASVKAEQLAAYPAINAVQALQGRAAGVQIQANNGAPGSDIKVRIRGGNSINASSDPIFVVDGFVGAAMPPPEDIASVEVLKDASATAIYGSRGANGVVMITTKRGKTGAARIELNTSYSHQNEINRLDLLNAEQFVDYISEARPGFQSMGADTDWQDLIFRDGAIQNYQLSISGGSDAVSYYVSGSYFDQKGVILNSDYNRFSVTSNLDIKATDKIRFGLNLFAQRSGSDGVRTQEGSGGLTPGVVASAFKFEPDQPIYRENGTFTTARLNDPHDNPYAVVTQLVNQNTDDRFQGNMFAEYAITDDLKFRTTFGATTNNGRNGQHSPTTVTEGRNVGGDARINGRRSTLFLNENYLTYNRTFGDIHNVTAMAGYSFQSSSSESWGARGQSFITDAFSFWNLGSAAVWQTPNSNLTEWQISSYYGRLNYSLNDRFLFTFNARYDGSSTFSKNHKWAFFPSGAVAWNMKNEAFLAQSPLISFWKWRVSYGLTGNQAIEPYQTLAGFTSVFTVINNVPVNAVRPNSVANDNLTWETTKQLNVGEISGFGMTG